VSVISPSGSVLAVKSYTRSQAWDQINDLFTDMGIGATAVQGARNRIRATPGDASTPWFYLSIVDDRTANATYVLAIPAAP
jgi:hypothetical protein